MPTVFLALGLYIGGAAFVAVLVLSWMSGTVPEMAVLRGLGAFAACAFLGWLAAYIAGTVPPEQDVEVDQAATAMPAEHGPDGSNDAQEAAETDAGPDQQDGTGTVAA